MVVHTCNPNASYLKGKDQKITLEGSQGKVKETLSQK
jgi:hypothetical protein